MTNDCSDGSLPDSDCSKNPALNCVLPLDNEIDSAGLEGLKVDNINQASEDRFVFPLVTVHKTVSTSFRRSSMRMSGIFVENSLLFGRLGLNSLVL